MTPVSGFTVYSASYGNSLTDVRISLVPVGQSYAIQIEHSAGVSLYSSEDFLLYPDTVIHPQNWYRFQVFRHNDSVDVYLNGMAIDSSFISLDSTYADSVYIGFESGGNGTVIIDDIIIATPSVSMHPRLFFTPSDIPTLNSKRVDYNPGTSGIPPAVLWDTMYTRAEKMLNTDTISFEIHGTPYTYVYPFEWPPPAWTSILYQAYIPQYVQLEGFVYALTNDPSFADRVKNILLSLANWPQWEWPYYYENPVLLYIETQGFHYMLTEVIGYDLIYNRLTDFERMSIENAILVKGLEQLYLALTVGELGNRPVKHNKQLVGAATMVLGALVLSDTTVAQKYLNTAIQLIQDYLSDPNESYDLTTGAAREPIFYAQYAFTHLGMAGWALQKNNHTTFLASLKPFVQYMSQCQIPGGHKYVPFGDSPGVIDGYMEQFPEFYALIASSQIMPLSQWFLMKNNSYWGFYGQGLIGSYLYFGTFLWLDNTVPIRTPENLNLPFAQSFNTSGISVLRTGWESPENLFFSIKSRDNNKIHNHLDNNSISIAFNGKWLIGEHPDPYGRISTELHNTMVILADNDTIRQISGFDRGHIAALYEDSLLLYTETQARLSYRLNQGNPAVFVNDFSRSAILFPKDTLLLLMDVVNLPQAYKSRLQFKFHSQGQLTVLPDAFTIEFPDTAALYSRLWTSSPVTLTSYQFDPEFGGIVLTTDTSVTEFRAFYLMKAGTFLHPVDFQVFNYDSVLEAILETHTYVFFFDELNSYRYQFYSPSPSIHVWTGLTPGIRYWYYVITRDTFLFDSLQSDNSSFGVLKLPALNDTAEIYVYNVQSGTPYPFTYPTTQKKVIKSKHNESIVYDEGNMVFYQQKNGSSWDSPLLLDLGKYIAGSVVPGTDIPVVVYIGKRLGRQIMLLRWGINLNNSIVLDTADENSRVEFGYPGVISISEDTVCVAYFKKEGHESWYLLMHTISLHDSLIQTDTLDYGELNGISLADLGAPVLGLENHKILVSWVKPYHYGTSVYFFFKDSVWHSPVKVSQYSHGKLLSPQISSSDGIVYFVWETEGNIFFTTYDLANRTLGPVVAVEDDADSLGSPVFLTSQDILCNKWSGRSSIVRYRFTGVGWEFYGDFSGYPNSQYPQVSHGVGNEYWVVWTQDKPTGYYLVDTILQVNEREYLHGTILHDTTWSDSVFLNGDLTVGRGATLRLLPGTVVSVVPNYDFRSTGLDPGKTEITVSGKLIGVGTWRLPITFTSPEGYGSWTGIIVDSGGIDTLKNAYIEGSDVGLWVGDSSYCYLDSITISNAQEWAIYSNRAFFELYRSKLYSSGGGIFMDSSWAIIESNTIRSPEVGIRLTPSDGYSVIENNEILGTGDGIGIDAIKTHSNFRLRNNEIQGFDIGIYLSNASPEIRNNVVTAEYLALASGPNSSPLILANDFMADYIGIYSSYRALPFLGNESAGQPGFNSIRASIFSVVNASESQQSIMAEMNWWGTDSPSPSMFWGEVDYVPFLLSPPDQDRTTSNKENFGFTTQLGPTLKLTRNIVRGSLKFLLENIPDNTTLTFSIYDISGRVIKSVRILIHKTDNYVKIPLLTDSGLRFPAGIYFLKVYADSKMVWFGRILNL